MIFWKYVKLFDVNQSSFRKGVMEMTKKKRMRRAIVVILALTLVFSVATVTATALSVSTNFVTLYVGGDNPTAFSNRKTVSVGGTAWVAHLRARDVGKGVVCHQNRMSSFTLTASSGAKPTDPDKPLVVEVIQGTLMQYVYVHVKKALL